MTISSNWVRALLITLTAAAALGRSASTHAKDTNQMMAVDPRTLKFAPIPDMPTCASAAILRGDPRSGPAWVLLKLGSGCRVPWHWHTPTEELVFISGQGALEMKDGPPLKFVPGAYASLPSHHVHRASCTRACLFFSSADGAFDIHYVDANGEEIKLERALQLSTPTKRSKSVRKKK